MSPHAGEHVVQLDVDRAEGEEARHEHLARVAPVAREVLGNLFPWLIRRGEGKLRGKKRKMSTNQEILLRKSEKKKKKKTRKMMKMAAKIGDRKKGGGRRKRRTPARRITKQALGVKNQHKNQMDRNMIHSSRNSSSFGSPW